MSESNTSSNFRSPIIEPVFMPTSDGMGGGDIGISTNALASDAVLRTPAGNVRPLVPPPLPMAPATQYSGGLGTYGGSFGGYSNFGGLSAGYNGLGYGGYNGFGSIGGYGGYGNSYSAYNRFGMPGGMNPLDPEARFIQLAEATSRPAFESIESLVSAIGNIASMLDSTFFALTSSFRAILGVAANFGRLRGVFAQFWSTFAILRGLSWIYRKILFWLRISNLDPSSESFKLAFAEAINETHGPQGKPKVPSKSQSPWPVLAFLSFIITAPYLIMKLLGTVSHTAQEEARNPSKWVRPVESVAVYDFQARNPSELTLRAGQQVTIAPKEIQNTLGLLNTGWALATIDGQMTGIIPINYVKSPQQMRQEQLTKSSLNATSSSSATQHLDTNESRDVQPSLMNLSSSAFASPAQSQINSIIPDFEIAPQPVGPPSTNFIK